VLPGDVLWIARHNAIDVFDLVSGELTTTIALDNGQSAATAMTYSPYTGTVLMCSSSLYGAIYERTLEGAFVRTFTGVSCDYGVTRGPNGDVYSGLIVYDYDYNGTLRFSRWNQSGAFLGVTDREGFSGELGNIVWAPYDNPGPQNTNSPPVLSSFPSSATVAEGGTYSFIANATDPDGDSLRFQILNSGGALIDPVTGVFSWTPTEWQGGGEHTFRISVIDDDIMFPMTDERSITIRVNEVNLAPVLGVIGDQSGSPRNNFTFTATATDPDRPQNILTFSLIGAPAGAFINPSSGVFSWTPSRTQTGQFTFTVRVSDNGSPAMSDEQSVTVTVTNGRGR
jgi:Putative Ig domain/Bacterial Ig domain